MTDEPVDSSQPKQRITTIVMAVLAIVFVLVRIIARKKRAMALGLDDWTLIFGLFLTETIAGINLASVHFGMGRHELAISLAGVPIFLKLVYSFQSLYIVTVGIIKLCVLITYNRVFPVVFIRRASLLLGTLTIAWMISISLVAIFQCSPPAKAYDPMIPGHCINLKAALIGNGVPNFVTDMIILTLPARTVWGLQASILHRVSIILVFLSGSFVVFASLYRFSLIFKYDPNDLAWTLADAQTWCVVETSAGVISACLPMALPMLKTGFEGFRFNVLSILNFYRATRDASQSGLSFEIRDLSGTQSTLHKREQTLRLGEARDGEWSRLGDPD